ncbi:MAG: hypothetical protein QM779_14495 [Propionicimonas sp.]|uniref:hypothetical protein n=1 Tax=Propionicimonas sp. TaxID=1955623 RepID=UPI003D0C9FA2
MTDPAWPGRTVSRALLAGLCALILWGVWTAASGGTAGPGVKAFGDVDLYREIAQRVAAGSDYYAAAIASQLAHGYPTTPFLAVRLPTLTSLHLALGETGATVLLVALGVAGVLAMAVRLDRDGRGRAERIAAVVLLGLGVALLAVGPVAWFHEAWAGVLVLLAIAVHSPRRWWPSVLLALVAVCFRELALPYLVVMAVLAWPQRRREAWAWLAAIGVFAAVLAAHALAVQAAQPPTPVASNGWVEFGGWSFVLACVRTGSLLSALPLAVAAVVVPLALFGWCFAGPLARPVVATCVLLAGALMVVGRPDNTYWGLLFSTVLLAGLAFAPRGLVVSARAAFSRSAG